MNYAIVDIGSNAIKYKIFNHNLELVEYYRHPLRLGRDVFSKGYLEEKYRLKKLKSGRNTETKNNFNPLIY